MTALSVALADLNRVVRATGPMFTYDYRKQRMGVCPFRDPRAPAVATVYMLRPSSFSAATYGDAPFRVTITC